VVGLRRLEAELGEDARHVFLDGALGDDQALSAVGKVGVSADVSAERSRRSKPSAISPRTSRSRGVSLSCGWRRARARR
jgi:hypothetical protein